MTAFWRRDTPRSIIHALAGFTGRGVRVGVIGSGYDNDDPDPRVLPGVSFVDPNDDLEQLRTVDDHDRIGYGTTCARLVLRMVPDARIVPIRIFGEATESSPGTFHSALLWAAEERLDVVFVGASSIYPETLHPIYAACEKGRRNGVVLVSPANPKLEPDIPAQLEPVIGVWAGNLASPLDFFYRHDAPYEVEAWHDWETLAPDEISSRLQDHAYAAATVVGIVGLLRERYPGAPLDRIRELLQRFAL